MSGELDDLYQDIIIDHTKRPRNKGELPTANRRSEGYNPLCGDQVTIYLEVVDDRIDNVTFDGSGCAIATASASLLTEALKGKTVVEARALFRAFRALVTDDDSVEVDEDHLGKLVALAGVREFPMRVKCATLVWHTLEAALENQSEAVTTK